MQIEKISINKIKLNKDNPRVIKDEKFKKLVKSIQEFPEMLQIRPIVVNDEMIVLGGNQRLKACKDAGLKEVYIINAKELTEEQQKEFIIKDNVNFGDWDFEKLELDFNIDSLQDWGIDIFNDEDIFDLKNNNEIYDNDINNQENIYSKKIEVPYYEPNNKKPELSEIYNIDKYNKLIKDINSSDLSKKEKEFLIFAASRHIEFNYELIADFYSHSNKEMKEFMEQSALVIIDYNKALSLGYVVLSEKIRDLYIEDYGDEIDE